jgi:EmrB/QacA subfamily drug resistance transporter
MADYSKRSIGSTDFNLKLWGILWPMQTANPITYTPVSRWALGSLLTMLFLAAIDTTILSTAMPKVIAQLGGSELYHWVFAAFMVASTVATPFYGKFADLLGIRRCMLVAVALFLVGSALCGSAQNMPFLIASRALQGLGAAGLMGLTMIAFGVLFPPEQRGARQSMVSVVWGLSSLVGPLLGGFMVSVMHWSWIFWFNLPLGLITTLVFYFSFPSQARSTVRKPFDWTGAFLLLIGLSLTMLFLAAGKVYLLPLAVIGGLALFFFVRRQNQVSDPLIPMHFFKSKNINTALGLGFVSNIAMFTALTYVPLFLQEVMHRSPTEAGLILTPMMLAWPLASAGAGINVNKYGFRSLILLGAILMLAGLSGWSWIDLNQQPLWLIAVFSALMGCGMGMITSMLVIMVQVSVKHGEIGTVSAILNLSRNLGSSGGLSALGAMQVILAAQMNLAQSLKIVFFLLWGLGLICLFLSTRTPATTPAELNGLNADRA